MMPKIQTKIRPEKPHLKAKHFDMEVILLLKQGSLVLVTNNDDNQT